MKQHLQISSFLLLSSLILLYACSTDNKTIKNKQSNKKITELEIISDAIELTEDYLNNYHTQTVFSKGGNDYMVNSQLITPPLPTYTQSHIL